MFKFLKNLILAFVLIIAAVVVFRNFIVKTAMEQVVKSATGLSLQVASVDIPLTKLSFGVKGVRLFNPEDFPDPLMLNLPELLIAYDLPAILKKDIHLQEVRVDLKELTIVRDRNGVLNLDSFKKLQPSQQAGKGAPAPATPPGQKPKTPPLRIDLLVLKVGKVTFKDYSKASQVVVKEFPVNLDERIEHITDVNVLVQTIVFRALSKTDLNRILGPELQAVGGLFGQAFKSTTDLTNGTVKTTTGVLKTTVQGVTGILTSPFQKEGK